MKIEYTKYDNYDPVALTWIHSNESVELSFNCTISALYSDELESVVVEIYEENKLNFYSLSGELLSCEEIPKLTAYQFRGINKNTKSRTGISFLFHPEQKSEWNKWGDTEQYEMLTKPHNRLGDYLCLYR